MEVKTVCLFVDNLEPLFVLTIDQGQDAETQEEAWKEGCTCQAQGINQYIGDWSSVMNKSVVSNARVRPVIQTFYSQDLFIPHKLAKVLHCEDLGLQRNIKHR